MLIDEVRSLQRILPRSMTAEESLELVTIQRDEWKMACYVSCGLFLFILLLASRR